MLAARQKKVKRDLKALEERDAQLRGYHDVLCVIVQLLQERTNQD